LADTKTKKINKSTNTIDYFTRFPQLKIMAWESTKTKKER
jgi:hypothetical protein